MSGQPSITITAACASLMSLHSAILGEKTPRGHGRAPHRGAANIALSNLLRVLIDHGAHFALGDFALIDRLGARATNGSFQPLSTDVYARALSAGNGSAADSWEHAAKVQAWPWPGTQLVPRHQHLHVYGAYLRPTEIIPAPLRRVHPRGRLCIGGVWWRVYQLNADQLKIAAYPGDDGLLQTLPTKGVERVTHTRATWEAVVAEERAIQKAAGGAQ